MRKVGSGQSKRYARTCPFIAAAIRAVLELTSAAFSSAPLAIKILTIVTWLGIVAAIMAGILRLSTYSVCICVCVSKRVKNAHVIKIGSW